MIEYENECVGCGAPCLGSDCPYMNVPHYYCDCCGMEFEAGELYDYENEARCIDCIEADLTKAYV